CKDKASIVGIRLYLPNATCFAYQTSPNGLSEYLSSGHCFCWQFSSFIVWVSRPFFFQAEDGIRAAA
ncbi:hypothetical protein OHV64_18435, partial [Acinetobacter baumannii]|nr:hypothetical protein [Acinetobacter baumannii]